MNRISRTGLSTLRPFTRSARHLPTGQLRDGHGPGPGDLALRVFGIGRPGIHRLSRLMLVLIIPALILPACARAGALIIEHDLQVRIDPDAGTLQVRDRLQLPDGRSNWVVLLHRGLDPEVIEGDAVIRPLKRTRSPGVDRKGPEPLQAYELTQHSPGPLTLQYGGEIRHDLAQIREGMGRTREWSRGTISTDGVVLDGRSAWYPMIPETLQTFSLQVTLPQGWTAVSQGAGPGDIAEGTSHWIERNPQDDIYLLAAPFEIYRSTAPGFEAQVFLREADPDLARRYLDATKHFVALYAELIGPYPFAKFALVENFWETGYGMPSFTLLGPRVIRLPFILQTSYPHEILHNWWGNGVYVDYASGNWSEGLTNYLADHLMRERAGDGWAYRRETLKRYADYVQDSADFPVVAFRGRHDEASQAIGYGKSAMFFHMLRRAIGDDRFKEGLRAFYADHRFSVASFDDLKQSFETAAGQDLGDFFAAWTERVGAPRLSLTKVEVAPGDAGFKVTGRVEQTQSGTPFPMLVPILIHQEAGDAVSVSLMLEGREGDFEVLLPSAPVRVAVDPWFDVFRALLPGETPVSLSNLFGAERGMFVLPSKAPSAIQAAYQQLAEAWQTGRPGWTIRRDEDIDRLPEDRPVWLLGWENRWLDTFAEQAEGFRLEAATGRLTLGSDAALNKMAVHPVFTARRGGQALGWLAASRADAVPGLARKLPHYGKYSYLLFSGREPDNLEKGQWPAGDSDLVHWFGPKRTLAMVGEPQALVPRRHDEQW